MRLVAVPLSLLLLASAFAGCMSPDTSGAVAPAEEPDFDAPAARARVVVADIDTGVNPYHVEFRDTSPEAFAHPSTYLAGFPADAPALMLTFDAEDYDAAVAADCAVWEGVETGKLYWIPGTRIVGAITFSESFRTDCAPADGKYPTGILDSGSHGTMTTSRVAGATYSLCPECKIVSIQGFSSDAMLWSAQQPYIDLQTNSWGALPTTYALPDPTQDRGEVLEAARMQPTFVAGGNGMLGFFGVTGHPAYLDNIAGPDGIIMVGGHDGGRFTPWTMTMPHVVADANWHPAAKARSLDGGDDKTGGGTSGSTPFAASTFARIVLEGRMLVNDTGTGPREGNLVVAGENATLPADGPLADGMLTIDEAKVLFFHTANPRPVRDGDRDGATCDPTGGLSCALYPTSPVEWGMIPEALPAYYFVGYGQVGEITLEGSLAALRGEAPIPERPTEDQFYGFDQQLRRGFDG